MNVLFHEHIACLGRELWMKRARIPNVPLQGLGRELGRNGRVTESVNVDNVLRNVPVHSLVAFVQYDEKQVET